MTCLVVYLGEETKFTIKPQMTKMFRVKDVPVRLFSAIRKIIFRSIVVSGPSRVVTIVNIAEARLP
jgi:hypothetical protein